MKFTIVLPDCAAISEKTNLTINGMPVHLKDNVDIAKFIKRRWCKYNNVKSFTQWANELNNDTNIEGNGHTVWDALDNLSSLFILNINGKHVNIIEFFKENLPFTQK
jgi:hypothetical protein